MPHTGINFTKADPGPWESAIYSFDFGPGLAVGETISTATWTMEVIVGIDALASTRLIGAPQIYGSQMIQNGVIYPANTITAQKIGGLLANVTYRAVASVTTSQNQTLTLYAEIPTGPAV